MINQNNVIKTPIFKLCLKKIFFEKNLLFLYDYYFYILIYLILIIHLTICSNWGFEC